MKATCDKCKVEFTIDLKEKALSKGVKEAYFRCSNCNERYTAYKHNNKIVQLQRQIKGLRSERQDKIKGLVLEGATDKDIDKTIKDYQEQIDNVKVQIENEMDRITFST